MAIKIAAKNEPLVYGDPGPLSGTPPNLSPAEEQTYHEVVAKGNEFIDHLTPAKPPVSQTLKGAFESGKLILKVKDTNGHVSEHKLMKEGTFEPLGSVKTELWGAPVLSATPDEATPMEKAEMAEDFLAQLTAEPAQQYKAKPATGKITTKEHKESGDTMKVEETTMAVKPIPVGLLHNVNVAGSRKFQLENYGGNKYESVELHVSLTIPCTKETIDDAYEFASTWVSDKIEAVEKKLKGAG
jgi:hypothetical protein